ncbi:MAG: SHOCT-like domain-containing protein [Candidatus Limnocylindria bacterium]
MGDELATVLRLVSEGKLTPEEAAPIIEALTRQGLPTPDETPGPSTMPGPTFGRGATRGRRVRIQVSERGRRVVDVRVPLAFAAMAATMVPGIPDSYAALIRQAVETDQVGPIVDAEDEDGDAVLISIE